MQENIITVINNIVGHMRLIFLIGLFVLIFSEKDSVFAMIHKCSTFTIAKYKKWKKKKSLSHPFVYLLCFALVAGILMIIFSRIIFEFSFLILLDVLANYYAVAVLFLGVVVMKYVFYLKKNNEGIVIIERLITKFLYMVFGVFIVLIAYSITEFVIDTFLSPSNIAASNFEGIRLEGFWSYVKYQNRFTGLFTTIGIIFTGLTLILSGGTRWLVNLSKVLFTISIVYLVFNAFVLYA